MSTHDLPVPAHVLAIGAHPDDVEFGCGATLAKWAALGAHCELLVLTDGSKGSWDPDADPTTLIATRDRDRFHALAPEFTLTEQHWFSFLAYPLSGGFKPWSVIPDSVAKPLLRFESVLEKPLGRLFGFRLLLRMDRR